MRIYLKKTDKRAIIPEYQTKGAAGFDFHAIEEYIIDSGCTGLVKTGLSVKVPTGYELQVRPRSGMSLKTKIRVANSPGTIDSDYRGEIGIIIDNIGKEAYVINAGDRIAQGVLSKVYKAQFIEKGELDETERADKGFGSTDSSTSV